MSPYARCCLLVALFIPSSAQAQTETLDYRELCTQKLGDGGTGLILRDIDSEQWELIAVASGPIKANDSGTPQGFREAVLVADALAHQTLAEFIAGVRVKGSEEALTENKVIIDSQQATTVTEQLSQEVRSHQQQDVFAFLRGTRRVTNWQSKDGSQAYAVVTLNPSDIQKGVDISRSISERELGSERFEVVQTTGVDSGPQRVRVVGMATIGTRAVEEARRVAIYDGLHLAVQRVAGLTLSSRTSLEDLQRLQSHFTSITAGMVKSFLILEEKRAADTYSVVLEAEVQRDLGGNLDLLKTLLGNISVGITGTTSLHPFDSNYCLDGCRRGLEQRGVPYTNLGFNPGTGHGRDYVQAGLSIAMNSGMEVMIWCDTDEWLQAYCVATGEKIGQRLTAKYRDPSGSEKYGWATWEPWNEWFDGITQYWYDEAFNGTFVSVLVYGEYLSSPGKWYASWSPDGNVSRRAAGRIEDVMKALPKCKSIRRTTVDTKNGVTHLQVRWAGLVDEIVRQVFEQSEERLTGSDLTLNSLELKGNVIEIRMRSKP